MIQITSKKTLTIRIESDILSNLERLAKGTGQSLNALINHLLILQVNWYCRTSAAGIAQYPVPLIDMLLEKVDEDEVKEIARRFVAENLKDIMLVFKQKYDAPSFLQILELWLTVCDVDYIQKKSNNTDMIIIKCKQSNQALLLAQIISQSLTEFGVRNSFKFTKKFIVFNIEGENGEP